MRFAIYSNWIAFLALAALMVWMRYAIARAEQELEHEQAMQSLSGVGSGNTATQPQVKGAD